MQGLDVELIANMREMPVLPKLVAATETGELTAGNPV